MMILTIFGRMARLPWLVAIAIALAACSAEVGAPQFDVASLPAAVVDEPYLFDVKVEHEALADVTLTLVEAPAWLELREGAPGTGQLRGRPPRNAEGTFPVHIVAVHGTSQVSGSLRTAITIDPARGRFVSAGFDHSMMITTVGEVYTWGSNAARQLGYPAVDRNLTPRKVTALDHVTAASGVAGDSVTMIVDTLGRLWVWGLNAQGQLGIGSSEPFIAEPTRVAGALADLRIRQVAVGLMHTLAVTDDGSVYAWGSNNFGQLGKGDRLPTTVPVLIPSESFDGRVVIAVAAGDNHSIALTDNGALYVWGDNTGHTLGIGTDPFPRVLLPRPIGTVPGVAEFTAIHAHGYESLALTSSGRLFGWGANNGDQLGIMNGPVTRPGHIVDLLDLGDTRRVTRFAAGNAFTGVTLGDGEFLIQGTNEFTRSAGVDVRRGVVRVDITEGAVPVVVTDLSGGDAHMLALDEQGRVYAWGRNLDGRVGNGRTVDALVPQRVYPPIP
jgi:alpha-tubulin suppressor-like RCC1 family protein